MTTLKNRQPTKLDYASPTQFKFGIAKLPKVEYFCTSVNIPGIYNLMPPLDIYEHDENSIL